MQNARLESLRQIAEGANLPPPPERQARMRARVQQAKEALDQILPQLHAKVSALTPRLIGPSVESADAAEVDRICQEIGDLARKLGTQGEALRSAVGKFRTEAV